MAGQTITQTVQTATGPRWRIGRRRHRFSWGREHGRRVSDQR